MVRQLVLGVCLSVAGALAAAGQPATAQALPAPGLAALAAADAAPALGTSDRLDRRRFVAAGTRAYEVGTEQGRYPVMGFHTRGEMGGIWAPPVKLLDGLWFGVDGQWAGAATRFTRGYGSVRFDLPDTAGVALQRTDVVPDDQRAVLVGLRLTSATDRTVRLTLAAHSELMGVYPWGETTPSQLDVNGRDTAAADAGRLAFTDARDPYAAVVGAAGRGADLVETGRDFRGPQDPAQVCPPSGPDAPPAADSCDDTAYGAGAGGALTYRVRLAAGRTTPLWFVVAGSDQGLADAQRTYDRAAQDPAAELAAKLAQRTQLAARSVVSLPGSPRLERSLLWSRQDLADLHQSARDLQVRETNAGTSYPAPVGTVPRIEFEGAGYPDYPWLFATDGEYTAYALVATGQTELAKDHLRALRDISDLVNERSGKIVHEVTTDGSVFFGANADGGNTDESVKYPSAVALVWRWTGDDGFRDEMYDSVVRALDHVTRTLDADGDGWPEGAGNVERLEMGEEKLDNAVYLVRGLYDLAAMATSRGEGAAGAGYRARAAALEQRFHQQWWLGDQRGAAAYADSLLDPGDRRLYQRYWTGLVPLEAELPAQPGRPAQPGITPPGAAVATLDLHETPCFTGRWGLFHTGSGPGTDTPSSGCRGDRVLSQVPDERDTFTLNSAIAAVAEGNYGRIEQALGYSGHIADLQFPAADNAQAEMPGAMVERAGGDRSRPDYYADNLGRRFAERGMVMQAWGAYGTWWPVVHQLFGVAPDLGQRRLDVVPQLPSHEHRVVLERLVLGQGSVREVATRAPGRWTTEVTSTGLSGVALQLGAVLPADAAVTAVLLDGRPVAHSAVRTHRGLEVTASVAASGTHRVEVRVG